MERKDKILKAYHTALEVIAGDHNAEMDTKEYWLNTGATIEELAEQLAADTRVARATREYALNVEMGFHDGEALDV